MARVVTVEGMVEAHIVIEDADDDDDAREQAERLFRRNLTFDSGGIEVEDFSVSQEEATEVVNDED